MLDAVTTAESLIVTEMSPEGGTCRFEAKALLLTEQWRKVKASGGQVDASVAH